jgi:2-dehydro-3-deoxy-D-gluconate 5-dehydrogenase
LNFDILANCGGITRRAPPEDFPNEEWNEVISALVCFNKKVLQVNLTAPFQLSRDFAKHLLNLKKPGRIINIASLNSFQGILKLTTAEILGGKNTPAYASSKGAIKTFTQSCSNAWSKHGILVNAIAPGYVETDMTASLKEDKIRSKEILDRIPMGRWAKPDEFVGPAIFLASDASSYVTGSTLIVDGGWMGY